MTPEEADEFNRLGTVSVNGGKAGSLQAGNNGAGPPGGLYDQWGNRKAAGQFDVDSSNVDALNARMYGYQGQQQVVSNNLGRTATGEGYQGQARNAAALEAMANRPQSGPSAAELAMHRQSQQAMGQNLAMAATGTGASGNSLMLNAMNRNAMQQGDLTQQLGIQRANEANQREAMKMQALQGAAGIYGQAAGTQQAAYTGQAGILGNVSGQNAQMAGIYGGIAQSNAQNALAEQKMKNEEKARQDAMFAQYLGAGASAMGGMMSAGATTSDIRAKKDIKPAERDISELYRGIESANAQAERVRSAPGVADTFGNLSGSSYGYVDPRLGNGANANYGPMAQELERTPAGQSVVTQAPNGMKGVDTSRLALLNASETGQQRREIDRLKAQLATIQGQGDQIRSLPPAVRPEGYGY